MKPNYIYALFVLFLLVSCQKASTEFTAKDGSYTLTLPPLWEEYDDGDELTDAFYNARNWTGNFRVTKLKNENSVDIKEYINKELQEVQGARLVKIGEYECAHSQTMTHDNGEELNAFFWSFGKGKDIFICSFTTDHQDRDNRKVMGEVEGIIKSLKINTNAE